MIIDNDKTVIDLTGSIYTQLNLLGWVPYVPEMKEPHVFIFKSNPDITLQLDEYRELDSVYINFRYEKCCNIDSLIRIMKDYDIR